MRRRLAALPLLGLTVVPVAWGYWTADPAPGAQGAAVATSVGAGSAPSATASGSSVSVSWPAATVADGRPVTGYLVRRYTAGSAGALQTTGAGCAGTVTTTSCTETAVPDGSWRYAVVPVVGTSWRGAESPRSTATLVDTVAPANNLSVATTSSGAALVGTTLYYRSGTAGSLRITNAVSDAASGPASSATSALSGTSTGWTHVPSTISAPAGGPYPSDPLTWTAGSTSTPQVTVTGRDVAGNTAATVLSLVPDGTAPTGGSVDATGLGGTGSRWATSTTINIAFTTGTDDYGLAPTGRRLLRASAPLSSAGTAEGTCGTFTAYALVTGGTDPVSPRSDTVVSGTCYRYRYEVPDLVGNLAQYTSPDIKVDTSAPAAPVGSFSNAVNAYWSGNDANIWYRPDLSGSIKATATASDNVSGIASFALPTLGTGWSQTLGAAGVATYSWTPNPANPGTKYATATNHAGLTSPGQAFTPTPDNTPPTGVSVTYTGGTTYAGTLPITLAASDAGSGLGTRLLQRATATLTGTTCGTFGSFATIATNPASPYSDSLARGSCYQYQYVVQDNLGNQTTTTSPNVVQRPTYAATVQATTGLVGYYRLDEAATSVDAMSGTAGATLQSRTGSVGATWTRHAASGSVDAVLTASGTLRKGGAGTMGALYYSSGVPASADYAVEARVVVASTVTDDIVGVVGRLDPASSSGTYYYARYEQPNQKWILFRVVNGGWTWLGESAVQALTPGSSYRLTLDMRGSTIRVLVDGVQQVSVTDATITAAGRGGVALGFHGANTTTITDTTGLQLDDFRVLPPVTDPIGGRRGDLLGGVGLGATGAIAGDADTAVSFDGVDDFVSVPRVVADDFSLEVWFKSTGGIGTGAQWWSGAGLVDGDLPGQQNDFGVSLRSDGRVVGGVGGASDTSVVSTAGGYNDGAWHHVVFTRTKATGALALYVDGAAAGTATGSTVTLDWSATLVLGRIATQPNFFAGSLDELAFYSTPLSSTTVAAHNSAGR